MHFEDSPFRTKRLDHLVDVLLQLLAAFGPRAHTKAEAEVLAPRNIDGALVSRGCSKDASHSTQSVRRRVVRMETDSHPCFFRHGHYRLDEVRETVPDFRFRIGTPVRIG